MVLKFLARFRYAFVSEHNAGVVSKSDHRNTFSSFLLQCWSLSDNRAMPTPEQSWGSTIPTEIGGNWSTYCHSLSAVWHEPE